MQETPMFSRRLYIMHLIIIKNMSNPCYVYLSGEIVFDTSLTLVVTNDISQEKGGL